MSLFQAILTVARYEAKTLLRSWFFRIFAVLFLVLIGFFDAAFFVWERSARWVFMGMPAGIPYANLLLLNVLQSVVAIFLASDFLKYDRKLDTTDVIYMRSMTNASYVLGKVLGVLSVFILLNVAVLAVGAVINVFFTDMPFIAAAYGVYPLLISLPTLVFVFGLTFLLMVLVRNQALVFVILLGYIAATLFFLQDNLYNLLDYAAFSQPMAWSDFVGMGDMTATLYQRGFYLLLGVGLTLLTVLMLRRLPQNTAVTVICAIGAALCLAGAGVTGYRYVRIFEDGKSLRAEMLQLNESYGKLSPVSLTGQRIEIHHEGDRISATTDLAFFNRNDSPVERYRFSLNPGLDVTGVTRAGASLRFERERHILLVHPERALEPGEGDSLTVSYAGSINQDACYLDMDDSTRYSPYGIAFFTAAGQHAFVRKDYLLLTPESGWYPSAALPEGPRMPTGGPRDYIRFRIDLTTSNKDLNALAPGARDSLGDGRYVFEPATPLPRIHLAAGRYDKMALGTDSLEYAIYFLRGHDFFTRYFPDIEENIPEILNGFINGIENRLDLEYPFERLALVETPLQLKTFNRPWLTSPETVQPEHVLLPEKALFLQGVDFRLQNYYMSRGMQRGGRARNPEDLQRNMLNQFLNQNLSGGNMMGRQAQAFRRSTGQGFSLQRIAFSLLTTMDLGQDFTIFPMFHSLTNSLSSERWPVLDLALDNYLRKRLSSGPGGFFSLVMGPTAEDEASMALARNSLNEVLADPSFAGRRNDILAVKSNHLFSLVESVAGSESFKVFIRSFLASNRFSDCPAEVFLDSLESRFGLELGGHLDTWLNETKLAAFLFGATDCREVLDGNQTRYQVSIEVTNSGEGDGLLGLSTRVGGRGGFGFGGPGPGGQVDEEKFLFRLSAGESRRLYILLDEAPGMLNVDTYVSGNIPSRLGFRLGDPVVDHASAPFEGERPLAGPVRLEEAGTIIVDNEDPGFRILRRESEGKLKSLIASRSNGSSNGDYQGIYFWNPPRSWTPASGTDFYGTYRHSARYIRAGKGENRVSWTAQLPKSGQYDVYYHVTRLDMPWGRRGGRGGDNFVDDLHFTVRHDDGEESVEMKVGNEQTGWVLLNTWYFSEGPAAVELSDRSKGRIVYADAVKWVEHR